MWRDATSLALTLVCLSLLLAAEHVAVIGLSSTGEIEEIRSRSVGLGKAVYTARAPPCQGGRHDHPVHGLRARDFKRRG